MSGAGIFQPKYQPQIVHRVPGGYHAVCAAPVCIRGHRRINPGGEYVVAGGKAQHLDCNVRAQEALLKQEQTDSAIPPIAGPQGREER